MPLCLQSNTLLVDIAVWEMFVFGSRMPYDNLMTAEVHKQVADGRRLERVEGCPAEVYRLMERCWASNQTLRPTFTELVAEFAALARPGTRPSGLGGAGLGSPNGLAQKLSLSAAASTVDRDAERRIAWAETVEDGDMHMDDEDEMCTSQL